MEQSLSKKIFHICMIIAIIIAILLVVGVIILRYQVEGETNPPFELSKITLISSVDTTENKDTKNKWNLNIHQNNDIYLYIEKNKDYGKTEIIKDVTLDNFVINKVTQNGEKHLYKPVNEKNVMFKNAKENIAEQITYTGDLKSNVKEQKISNQGGLVVFRYANDNVAKFVSNKLDEIDYSKLLKTANVNIEDLKADITFDLTINLKSGKQYQANIHVNLPVENLIETGTASQEITDLNDVVFKRTENN